MKGKAEVQKKTTGVVNAAKTTAGVLGKVKRAAEAVDGWAKREMPKTRSYVSYKARQFDQNVVEPVVAPVRRAVVKVTHAAQDGLEAKSTRKLAQEGKQKLKVDFTSAAQNLPKINRNTTTAQKTSGPVPGPTRKR